VKRLLLAALLAGCGSSSGAPPVPMLVDAGPFIYAACDPAARVGDFRIELETSFTAVSGRVQSGVDPAEVPQVLHQEGDCRLVGHQNPFCSPDCASGMRCAAGNKCVPEPTGLSAGTVTIAGLSAPVTMMPSPMRRYDYNTLPHPGFTPGAEIQLRAAGAEVPAFFLRGFGVAPLDLLTTGTVLEPGKDLVLAWTPGPPGPARVAFDVTIDQHGLTRATLSCETADTGTATVPAALVDALVALGTTGVPKVRVARRTADAVTLTSGCVELQVTTAVERPIKVPGHDPCTRDLPTCPPGKTCDVALETCK
jgi:hypothetical protein